ncbi:MAG: MarR family transcriptional regulator [Pseudomonadota bacterium]
MASLKDDELVVALTTVTDKAQKQLASALSYHGLGFSEYLVLRCLQKAPAHKMRRIDLAQQLSMSASGITRLLNPMEKTGLIAKEANPRDARVSLVTLSASGARIFAESSVSFAAGATSFLEGLGKQARKDLAGIVTSLT